VAELDGRWQPWSLGLSVSLALGGQIQDPYATAHVERDTAALRAGLAIFEPPRSPLRIWGLVHAGLGVYQRTTGVTRPDLQAAPPRSTFSFVAGPDVRVELGFGRVLAALTVGVDVWARPPAFGHEIDGAFVAFKSPWAVQPRVALEISLESH
jgi:hypothetical protein